MRWRRLAGGFLDFRGGFRGLGRGFFGFCRCLLGCLGSFGAFFRFLAFLRNRLRLGDLAAAAHNIRDEPQDKQHQ